MASLAHSNKHLATAAKRKRAVQLTLATSSAIEGIRAPFERAGAARKPADRIAKVKRAGRAKYD